VKRLREKDCVFFLCDIQERVRDIHFRFEHVVSTAQDLVKFASILEIPVLVTEHYRKALGPTVSQLIQADPKMPIFQKVQNSMLTPEVVEFLKKSRKNQVVLFGLETHVCILQTTLDLLEQGFEVFLVTDGLSSSSQIDRTTALSRLQQAGAVLTTSASAMLEIIKTRDHPKFKEIMNLNNSREPKKFEILSSL
jgi:isochorismate hydrolase